MQQALDWKRVHGALFREARKRQVPDETVKETLRILPDLIAKCGPYTVSRKVAERIGQILLSGPTTIIAPSCPDYFHRFGRYTFKGVGDGVPLLARRHIEFLKAVTQLVPESRVLVLVADHEADDAALCRATGRSRKQFLECIHRSVEAVREEVAALGWDAKPMTEVVTELVAEEPKVAGWIRKEEAFIGHIKSETLARQRMYAKVGHFTLKEMIERTIRTAANYVILGRFASKHGYMVSNHTTTNLAWYLRVETALLHNPTNVY